MMVSYRCYDTLLQNGVNTMGRPRLHDEQTERELLAAAERLLANGGMDALSVRALAEAAGSTTRAVYTVFGGKEGLLRALYREAFRALEADLKALALTDDPAADLVAAGVEGFRGWARAHPQLFRLAFEDAAPRAEGPVEETGVQAFGRLRERVRRCIDAGLIAEGREMEVALSFHALCEGLAVFEARGRFPLLRGQDPVVMWRSALTALVTGYAR
jgi:AcrR family transcriptional regulator